MQLSFSDTLLGDVDMLKVLEEGVHPGVWVNDDQQVIYESREERPRDDERQGANG